MVSVRRLLTILVGQFIHGVREEVINNTGRTVYS